MNSSLRHIFEDHGRPVPMAGNTPACLTDTDLAVHLMAGKAEVFAQRFKDGRPVGARVHFFTAEPGDTLFGVPETDAGLRLLAVGCNETIAREISCSVLAERAPSEKLQRGVENFISRLGEGIVRDLMPKPRLTVELTSGTRLALDSRTTAGTRTGTVWLTKQEGSAPLFLGLEDLPDISSVPFPMTPGCRLVGTGQGTVETAAVPTRLFRDKSGEMSWKTLSAALQAWCDTAFRSLEMNTRMNLVDTLNTIKDKQTLDRKRAGKSVRDLASVLRRDVGYSPPVAGTPLFRTLCRVGAASGIRFRSPAGARRGDSNETPERIAQTSGIRYRKIRLHDSWWKEDHGPLLAFLRDSGVPVAVVPNTRKRMVVHYPDGTSQPLNRSSASALTEKAYIFHAPLPSRPVTLKSLAEYGFKGLGKDFRAVVFTAMAVGFLSLVLPISAKAVFGSIVPASSLGRLAAVMYVAAGAVLASGLLRLAGSVSVLRLEALLEACLETALWDRLLRMPLAFFNRYSAGNLAGRGAAFQRIREIFTAGTMVTLVAGIFSLTNLLLMLILAPGLGFAAFGLVVIQGLVTWYLTFYRLKKLKSASRVRAKLDGIVLQFITGLHQLRASNAEHRAFGRWAENFAGQQSFLYKAFQGRNLLRAFNIGYTVFSLGILFLIAGTAQQPMETGTFVAFYIAFGSLQSGILQIIGSLSQVATVIPQLERIAPILKMQPEDIGIKPDPGALGGKIDVSSVTVRYDENGPPALDGVGFLVEPGEYVALVGPSGSGKTTLLKLIAGLLEPDLGSICFDDRNSAELDARMVRRKMGIVLQDFGILPGTMSQAIAGDRDLSSEEIWKAAEISMLDHEIKSMEHSMDSLLTRNGNNLSGGQRQQLMIARAVAHNPAVLLMDEATSALDNETQAQVITNLESLKSTRIVVAHRLSTIRNADKILVLDQGRIVESGNFQSLMDKQGLFHSLAMRQLV